MKYAKTFSTLLTVLFSTTALAGHAAFFPAEHRPPNTGAHPAIGRAGSATLMARSMLGGDQITTVEVTTAPLFDALAPGNIDKLQVKLTHGRKHKVLNYNHLESGGSLSLPFEGLFRGDEMQLQANVSGIDPKRTGVVTLETTVQLRPDLIVTLNAPAQARVDEEVPFVATVTELNGDLDATTTVILEVDGQGVDRSRLLQVSPGQTTTTNLTHVFTTTGTKQLRLSAVDVNPGDYDLSNNSVTAGIEIVNDSLPFRQFSLDAKQDELVTEERRSDSTEDRTNTTTGLASTAVFIGYFPPVNLATTAVSVHHFTGAMSAQYDFKLTPATTSKGWFSVSNNGHSLTITRNPKNLQEFKVQTTRSSSRNTYFSEGWSLRYLGTEGTHYVINEEFRPSTATGAPGHYGSTYEVKIVLSDGEKTYEANPVIPLTAQTQTLLNTSSCYPSGTFGPYCVYKTVTYTKTRGFKEQTNY